jgi:uncharacterized protein YqeY
MKAAMKAKDNATLSTLRLLLSAIKNKQIDTQHDLSEEEIQAVIKTQVKQLKDAAQTFRDGGRDELAADSEAEIKILEKYLPAQMGDEELEALVKTAVEESGAAGPQDMGRAMGAAMKAVAGRADGNRVKTLVQKFLAVFALVAMGSTVAGDVHAVIPILEEQGITNYVATLLRASRVLLIWMGIAAITMMLNAGVIIATSGVRDFHRENSQKMMLRAVVISITIAILFIGLTIALQFVS